MENNEVIEGNKLIAGFMGYEITKDCGNYFYIKHPTKTRTEWSNRFQDNIETDIFCSMYKFFDNSWDWLMPVVEKIEEMNKLFKIEGYCSLIISASNEDPRNPPFRISAHKKTKIESTWLAVVEFIKWYKTTNPK